MDIIWMFVLIVAIQEYAFSVDLQLEGELYVTNGSDIWVNCSANTAPSENIAEFHVNGDTFDSIRRLNSGCFSAFTRTRCIPTRCQCNADGRMYKINVKSNTASRLDVVCSMKFKANKPVFKSKAIKIQVLDIAGPTITTEGIPLLAGTSATITCSAATRLNVELEWQCLNITSLGKPQTNQHMIFISFSKHMKTSYDGEKCICTVKYENYTRSTVLILNISNPPLLDINDIVACDKSSNVALNCSLSGDLGSYGFYLWTHYINGILIRQLNGSTHDKSSTLHLHSCSHFDDGEYTCTAWNDSNNRLDVSNKTTVLKVNDAPVIVDAQMYQYQNPVLSVYFYSSAFADIAWFRYDKPLQNSSNYDIDTVGMELSVKVYGKTVIRAGSNSNLSLYNGLPGEYTVIVRNMFGEVKNKFLYQKDFSDLDTFNLRTILWVLTAVGVFIATLGLMAVFTKTRNQLVGINAREINSSTERRAIYYAAPEDENNVHVYNSTNESTEDSHTDDSSGHYMEIEDGYEDLEKEYTDINQYTTPTHNYLDLRLH